MNKIRSSFRRFSYKLRHDFFSIENVVLMLAIFLCLMWTYQSIAAMSRNWELSERLTTERKNLEYLNLEVESIALENEYYKTDEYQELSARKHLDKKLPGENMLILPENSEEAKQKDQPAEEEQADTPPSNFDKWKAFLFPNY